MIQKSLLVLALGFCILSSCKKDDNNSPDRVFNIAKESYALPGNTFFPEGIAYDAQSGYFYTGSVANGDILKVNVETGDVATWAQGATQGRTAATGMKLDDQKRLWVCGGADGKVSVLDSNATLLKQWDLKTLFGAGFINDCISDGTHMYFTDSRVQKIYRAPLSAATPAIMEEWLSFNNSQILYDSVAVNANGIVATPDGQHLIIVVSSSGRLYRINKQDKSIREIGLNAPLPSGDGLLLEGNTLYVCRNAANTIVSVSLIPDFSQGTLGTAFGDNLRFNTTLARAQEYLLVVNGQLNRRTTNNPILPFTVQRVSVPR